MALSQLGIEEEPNIDLPWVSVGVSMNGAAPVEIEAQITRRIEDAVAGVANVKHIRSTVTTGHSSTDIEFELGTNADRATNDIREAVNQIRSYLPKGIYEPTITREEMSGGGSVTYSVSSSKRSDVELSWLIDNQISRALLANPNIGHANRFGGLDRQICVDLDPVRLEAFGVTSDQINSQLREQNINLPGGRGDVGMTEQSIRTIGSMPSIEELSKTRISLPGNRWVELSALGKVSDGVNELRNQSFLDGKPIIGMEITRRRGKNIVAVEQAAKKILADVQKKYPDLKFTQVFSDAEFVQESSSATFEALGLGALLAVVVIYLFLRDARAALIAAVAMPLSVIPTFAYMQSANFTLNDMSLLGLALVIGILVDDAIVEIENIVRHMNMGKKPFFAAIDAADEIGLAVVATTMAAVVVFLPVAFMGGIPGQFFRQFGLTVAVAVFCSLLVARLITPVMAAYWLKPHKEEEDNSCLARAYDSSLKVALKHRFLTVLAGILFFAGSLGLFYTMPTTLVSRIDRGKSYARVELAPGSRLQDTIEVIQEANKILLARPEVEKVFASAGEGEVNKGSISIVLKPKDQRKLSQDAFEDSVRPALMMIPGARISFLGGWGSGDVAILLTSYDPTALERTAKDLTTQMRAMPGLTDIQSTAQVLKPEIIVEPDFARAAEQGVSVEAIARTALVATMGDIGMNMPKFDLSDRQIPIVVRIDPEYRHKLSVISNMKVVGNNGRLVPLRSVAHVRFDSGLFKIDRYDRARQISVSAKYNSNSSLGQALTDVHNLPAFKNRPASVSDHRTGSAEIQEDIFGGFGYAIITGVLLIYAVLVLLFRGMLQPFTIMVSLPLSLGGALIALLALNKPIDMYALIGIVMLMGLVTKNAILLVEYCLVSMEKGMGRTEAIFKSGRTRMRPILMTTTAMIAGMLPIALAIGAGAEARAPMAIAVVGGLFMSTILTLLVVPVVFTYMDDFEKWLGKRFHHPERDGQAQDCAPPAESDTEETHLAHSKSAH